MPITVHAGSAGAPSVAGRYRDRARQVPRTGPEEHADGRLLGLHGVQSEVSCSPQQPAGPDDWPGDAFKGRRITRSARVWACNSRFLHSFRLCSNHHRYALFSVCACVGELRYFIQLSIHPRYWKFCRGTEINPPAHDSFPFRRHLFLRPDRAVEAEKGGEHIYIYIEVEEFGAWRNKWRAGMRPGATAGFYWSGFLEADSRDLLLLLSACGQNLNQELPPALTALHAAGTCLAQLSNPQEPCARQTGTRISSLNPADAVAEAEPTCCSAHN